MPQGTCSVEGCEKRAKTRGWCSAHYERWRRNGDPGAAGDARSRGFVLCAAPGCDRHASKGTYCGMHYSRVRRTGSLEHVRNWKAYRNIGVNGYVRVWCPGHPCARGGYALEHRKVWFDAHGPIPRGFHIHHVNHDRTDNRLENLELLSSSDHARLHHAERYGPDPCTVGIGG